MKQYIQLIFYMKDYIYIKQICQNVIQIFLNISKSRLVCRRRVAITRRRIICLVKLCGSTSPDDLSVLLLKYA